MTWQQFRTPFLATTFVGLILIFAKLVADPTLGKPSVYNFPATVPLSGWQPQANPTAVNVQQAPSDKHLLSNSKSYRYTQKNSYQLNLNMHYVVGTSGDDRLFIRNSTSIPLDKQLVAVTRYQKGIGYYELLRDRTSAHLVACINPQGESTVTRKQFLHNRNTYDLQPSNILLWLTAKSDLRDRRCLWTHLSMPLNGASTQTAERQLETAWVALYQWWIPRFPPL